MVITEQFFTVFVAGFAVECDEEEKHQVVHGGRVSARLVVDKDDRFVGFEDVGGPQIAVADYLK